MSRSTRLSSKRAEHLSLFSEVGGACAYCLGLLTRLTHPIERHTRERHSMAIG